MTDCFKMLRERRVGDHRRFQRRMRLVLDTNTFMLILNP